METYFADAVEALYKKNRINSCRHYSPLLNDKKEVKLILNFTSKKVKHYAYI